MRGDLDLRTEWIDHCGIGVRRTRFPSQPTCYPARLFIECNERPQLIRHVRVLSHKRFEIESLAPIDLREVVVQCRLNARGVRQDRPSKYFAHQLAHECEEL